VYIHLKVDETVKENDKILKLLNDKNTSQNSSKLTSKISAVYSM
jgi:hypothetical protein